jgi:hypothetical protein
MELDMTERPHPPHALPTTKDWKARALAEYPDVEPSWAFAHFVDYHVSGIFFLDEDGERCIWRSGKQVFCDPQRSAKNFDPFAGHDYFKFKNERGPGYFPAWSDSRVYYLRKSKVPMRFIDRPKERSLSLLVAHPSEQGWNLPKSHKRHFMKFPHGVSISKPESLACANLGRFRDQRTHPQIRSCSYRRRCPAHNGNEQLENRMEFAETQHPA